MTSRPLPAHLSEHHGTVNGLDFAWVEAGDPDAPLALCLHGFPDTPLGWHPLLGALADRGYHALAPYARGYAPTAVPEDGRSPISAWVADATAFHEQFGHEAPGVIVGHDWGALTTYGAAAFAPERWRRVVTAALPPISVLGARLLDYDQVHAFWYQYVFLQPTAEMIVTNNDFEFLDRLWQEWSPGYAGTDGAAAVKEALREPANLTAALSTYRAVYDPSLQPPELAAYAAATFSAPTQPTLYLHGADDGCVVGDVVDATRAALPEGSRVELLEGAGHFLQYEEPARVTELVLEHLGDAS